MKKQSASLPSILGMYSPAVVDETTLYVILLIGLRCKLICWRNLSRMSIMMHVRKSEWSSDIWLETALGKKVSITWNKINLVFNTICNKTEPLLACFCIGVCPCVRRNVKYCNTDFSQKEAFHVMRVCAGINRDNFCILNINLSIDFTNGMWLKI